MSRIALLVLVSPGSMALATTAPPRFDACAPEPGGAKVEPTLSCGQYGFSTAVMSDLGVELESGFTLQEHLNSAVHSQLDSVIAKYDRWSKCEMRCSTEAKNEAARLPQTVADMRVELALMSPDDMSPTAVQKTAGWFTVKPKHPFAKSPALAWLDQEEVAKVRTEFLNRVAKLVPSVERRLPSIKAKKDLLALTAAESLAVQKAMITLREQARKRYLSMIGKNPLLIFIDQKSDVVSPAGVAIAAAKLRDEAKTEKMRLDGFKKQTDRAEALIEYRSATELVLAKQPRLCVAANKLAKQSDDSRRNSRLALLAGQVTAGVVTAITCSTGIACVLGAIALAGADFAIASHDAETAFRSGIANSAIAESTPNAKTNDLMTSADQAAELRGVTLAMSLPTLVSGGATLLRAARTTTETAVKTTISSEAVMGRVINEVVGGPQKSRLNSFSRLFFKDVLDLHEGREKEIIETLIERMRTKGVPRDKISVTLKDRIHQCVR